MVKLSWGTVGSRRPFAQNWNVGLITFVVYLAVVCLLPQTTLGESSFNSTFYDLIDPDDSSDESGKSNQVKTENGVTIALIVVIFVLIAIWIVAGLYGCREGVKDGDGVWSTIFYFFVGVPLVTVNMKFDGMDDKKKKLYDVCIKLLICILSIVSAFSLSNSFNFETNNLTATIAIVCSILSLLLSCIRTSAMTTPDSTDTDSMFILSIMVSSVSDALFDIIQGMALLFGETYTNEAFNLLIAGTVIGASEEVIDFIIQTIPLFVDSFNDLRENYKCISYVIVALFFIGVFAEIGIAFYLGSLYKLLWLQIVTFVIQSVFAMFSCLVGLYNVAVGMGKA